MTKYITLIAILSVAYACNSNSNIKAPGSESHQVTTTIDSSDLYAVFKSGPETDYLFPSKYILAQLTNHEIKTVDSLLKIAVTEYNNGINNSHLGIKNLKEYRKQLVAAKAPDGSKFVYVNCFRDWESFKTWKRKFVFVKDGGSNFFSVMINLSDKKYQHLNVNGMA